MGIPQASLTISPKLMKVTRIVEANSAQTRSRKGKKSRSAEDCATNMEAAKYPIESRGRRHDKLFSRNHPKEGSAFVPSVTSQNPP
jgi:hypothetical protein